MTDRRDLVVRLTPDEYRLLRRMAVRAERDPERQATYLLRLCLQGDGPVRKEPVGAGAAG